MLDQFQPQWSFVRGSPSSSWRAVDGPRSVISASSDFSSSGSSAAVIHLPRCSRYDAIRCRITGHRSTGMNAWTCAQYSTIRRGDRSLARRSSSVS